MYNITLVHWLDVVAYRFTHDGLYMSITSPFICSILVFLLSSIHSQALWPGSLKIPSLSTITPSRITCMISCFHNRKSLCGGLFFGKRKVDHFSPTPLCFRYFPTRDFTEATSTYDKNNTCSWTHNLLSWQRLSVEYPTRLNYIIIQLSLFLGWSRGILHTSIVILNISTFSHILLNHPAVIQWPYLFKDSWSGWLEIPIYSVKSFSDRCILSPTPVLQL